MSMVWKLSGTPLWISSITCAALVASASLAQEPRPSPGLSVELNAAGASEAGCTLSFLVTNGYDAAIDAVVFETVLFDRSGQVDRLTLFDFGSLPPGRPRVRQFTLPDTSCEAIGRLLVNGASTCEASNLAPDACTDGLELSSRTEIEVIG